MVTTSTNHTITRENAQRLVKMESGSVTRIVCSIPDCQSSGEVTLYDKATIAKFVTLVNNTNNQYIGEANTTENENDTITYDFYNEDGLLLETIFVKNETTLIKQVVNQQFEIEVSGDLYSYIQEINNTIVMQVEN